MELKRVVVTGLGALTPIGNTYQEFWNGLVNGVSGAAPITLFLSFRSHVFVEKSFQNFLLIHA